MKLCIKHINSYVNENNNYVDKAEWTDLIFNICSDKDNLWKTYSCIKYVGVLDKKYKGTLYSLVSDNHEEL